jgi:ATP-dependent Clp protease ATP-binding subunit ClpC
LELEKVQKRLKEQKIKLEIDEETKKFLVEKGYDEKLGARPLRRAVEKYLEDILAEALLGGLVKKGKAIDVLVSEDGESLIFEQKKGGNKVSSKDKTSS